MTAEAAATAGARLATKEELLQSSDYISLHVVLSERSRGMIGERELAMMKPTAYLINTSRGPLLDERALLAALREHRIGGAGLDVFWSEPLAPDHPIRALQNVVLTPHLGYFVEESLRTFYEDTVENIAAWLAGRPIRLVQA